MDSNLVPFVEKIEKMAEVKEFTFGNTKYVTKGLVRIDPPVAKSLNVFSLDSLINFANGNKDIDDPENYIISVEAHNSVKLYSLLNSSRERECLVHAFIENPKIKTDTYLNVEDFNIMIQSQFLGDVTPNEEFSNKDNTGDLGKTRLNQKSNVLKITSSTESSEIRAQSDNGISQEVAVKVGTLLKGWESVPNPVHLIPLATFPEIEQPQIKYVLRAKQGQAGIQLALFNADGKLWEYRTIAEIKAYIKDQLPAWVII